MKLPVIRPFAETKAGVSRFLGLRRQPGAGPGEFYDELNLSSAEYPLLAVRKRRGEVVRRGGRALFVPDGAVTHMLAQGGHLLLCTENAVYYDGERVNAAFSSGEKKRRAVPFGKGFYVLPDCVFLTPDDGGNVRAEAAVWTRTHPAADVTNALVYENLSRLEYPTYVIGPEPPISPVDTPVWIDTSGARLRVRTYDENGWSEGDDLFILFEGEGLGADVLPGDELTFTGWPQGPFTVTAEKADADRILASGKPLLRQSVSDVTLTRRVPVPDFCFEAANRLWGCRWGPDGKGSFVNEIFCSALGSPTVWNVFRGISTDAWRVSVGAPGPFTGGAAVGNVPVFFKEDRIFAVYGDTPGEYSLRETAGEGVKEGAEGTLATAGERAYYLSRGGLAVYDGVLPALFPLPAAPGEIDGKTAAATQETYAMAGTLAGERRLLTLDLRRGIWHAEDDPGFVSLCRWKDTLFGVTGAGRIFCLSPAAAEGAYPFGADGPCAFSPEAAVRWYAETGTLVPSSPSFFLRGITFRLDSEEEAAFEVRVKGRDEKRWRRVCKKKGVFSGTFTVPVLGGKCDGVRLRFEGEGGVRMTGFSLKTDGGGEVNGLGR